MAKADLLLLAFLCVLGSAPQALEGFQLIPRSEWGAEKGHCPPMESPPDNVVISHTAGTDCHTKASCLEQVKSIQSYHMRYRRFCDIAFNFLVGEDGFVYEGVGGLTQGSHTRGYNDLSLGITFIGTFTDRAPNEAAWDALKALLEHAVKVGYLPSEYYIIAHSDLSNTVSPGKHIRDIIAKWPQYKQI